MALGVPILKHFRVNLEKMHCKHASAQSHEDFTTKKIGMSLNHKYAYEQEVWVVETVSPAVKQTREFFPFHCAQTQYIR